jgi:hypothetical protein
MTQDEDGNYLSFDKPEEIDLTIITTIGEDEIERKKVILNVN